MKQRFRVLQELGEQFERAGAAGELDARWRTRVIAWWLVVGFRLGASRRRLWAAIGASGTLVIGGVVAVILLLSAGAPAAYAGWSSVPTTPAPAQLATTISKCGRYVMAITKPGRGPIPIVPLFRGRNPVVAEAWGKYTAAVFVINGYTYTCQYSDPGSFTVSQYMATGQVEGSTGPDQLSIQYGDEPVPSSDKAEGGNGVAWGGGGDMTGNPPYPGLRKGSAAAHQFAEELAVFGDTGGYGFSIFGQAGSAVTAVSFKFANGKTVVAAVDDGWYLAWWPWFTYPTSVQVQTRSGTVTSPMTVWAVRGRRWLTLVTYTGPYLLGHPTGRRVTARVPNPSQKPIPACRPASRGCVFVNTDSLRAQVFKRSNGEGDSSP